MSGAALEARLLATRGDAFRLDVELGCAAGRTVALLGPNGSGKSSVVHALAGLLPLDAGRVRLGGRTLDEPERGVFVPPEERRIGVVFQDYVLFPHLTVAQNVAFGLRCRGEARRSTDAESLAWLRRLGLEEMAGRRPGDLSGGEAQRVALARALITGPELLLLDEPLAALDVSTRTRLRHTLSDHLAEFRGPRLLITHDPTEAFLLADEVYVLEDGAISQAGSADDIRLRPRTRYIADLAGSNLLEGRATGGVLRVDGHPLHVADATIEGDAIATVHPRAISLHRQRPEGSPRNAWATTVTRCEHYGDRVRVQVGEPLSLVVEVTPEAERELALGTGTPVWISIKATEIGVEAG
ncbi:MAG: ATP-binding cassette domain-containing protein [Myxococcota bacterium]|nr:ATP-binding cassette domain-containing protein [Myxococcota bacterium]